MSSKKVPKVETPDDPDPTPMAQSDASAEVQGAARAEKKRAAKRAGRQQTILAGDNPAADTQGKSTILGG